MTVLDDPAAALYPLAIDAAGQDDVFVGRIRRDPGHERALDMWIVADNLRKGAASERRPIGGVAARARSRAARGTQAARVRALVGRHVSYAVAVKESRRSLEMWSDDLLGGAAHSGQVSARAVGGAQRPGSLARHLGELGEIRITRVEPEKTVEWEAADTTGKVLLKASGWGTKVTLTAARELAARAADPARPGRPCRTRRHPSSSSLVVMSEGPRDLESRAGRESPQARRRANPSQRPEPAGRLRPRGGRRGAHA